MIYEFRNKVAPETAARIKERVGKLSGILNVAFCDTGGIGFNFRRGDIEMNDAFGTMADIGIIIQDESEAPRRIRYFDHGYSEGYLEGYDDAERNKPKRKDLGI